MIDEKLGMMKLDIVAIENRYWNTAKRKRYIEIELRSKENEWLKMKAVRV